VRLTVEAQSALLAAARDSARVRGLTHSFYKYPARFSPAFVRATINCFTEPGDLVLDPHVGGGTTLVEALASGRDAVGADISTLAEFVASVKSTVFTDDELSSLRRWSKRVPDAIDIHKPSKPIGDYLERGYYKHLNHPDRWRIRKAIEQSIGSALRLETDRLEGFARCAILRTAQWALDGRKTQPTVEEFRVALTKNAGEMIEGARELARVVSSCGQSKIKVLRRNAIGIETDSEMLSCPAPKLVVTSPPYPGIHVLYHRWQVDGRKEAPLPFMIADKMDGAGISFYAMGHRKEPELKGYFEKITASMKSVTQLADAHTTVVQMIAFSDPSWQLPRYLKAMEDAGLEEQFLPILDGQADGRLWRTVPGRRWYNAQRGATNSSKEVVLFHRKAVTPLSEAYVEASDRVAQ